MHCKADLVPFFFPRPSCRIGQTYQNDMSWHQEADSLMLQMRGKQGETMSGFEETTKSLKTGSYSNQWRIRKSARNLQIYRCHTTFGALHTHKCSRSVDEEAEMLTIHAVCVIHIRSVRNNMFSFHTLTGCQCVSALSPADVMRSTVATKLTSRLAY